MPVGQTNLQHIQHVFFCQSRGITVDHWPSWAAWSPADDFDPQPMKPLLQDPRLGCSLGAPPFPHFGRQVLRQSTCTVHTDSYSHVLVISCHLYISYRARRLMSLAKFTVEHIGTISDSKPSNFDPFPIFEDLRQSPSKPIISALRSRQMLEAILLRLAESTPCKHNARLPYMPFICLF